MKSMFGQNFFLNLLRILDKMVLSDPAFIVSGAYDQNFMVHLTTMVLSATKLTAKQVRNSQDGVLTTA